MLGRPKLETGGATWGFFYVPSLTRKEGLFVSDNKGHLFAEFFKLLASERGVKVPPMVLEQPDLAANEYITNYGMVVIIQNRDGDCFCYSYRRRNRLPEEFLHRVRSHTGLMPNDTVFWNNDVTKPAREGPAREIVYGQPVEKLPKGFMGSKKYQPPSDTGRETRKQKQQKWAKVAPLTQAEMDYLMGKTDVPPPGI